jgi:hypothetical protein
MIALSALLIGFVHVQQHQQISVGVREWPFDTCQIDVFAIWSANVLREDEYII